MHWSLMCIDPQPANVPEWHDLLGLLGAHLEPQYDLIK